MSTSLIYGIPVADVRSNYPDAPGATSSYIRTGVSRVVLHHDAMEFTDLTVRKELERLDAAYEWDKQHFGGIGYHLYAFPSGHLYWVRPLEQWGAHIAKQNDSSLGICLAGNYVTQEPTQEGLCAVSLALIACWRYAGGLRSFGGHNSFALAGYGTQCPGPNLESQIGTILQYAAVNVKLGR